MSGSYEGQVGSVSNNRARDAPASWNVRPPNKKKYEEEIEKLLAQIKDKESELDRIKLIDNLNITSELQRIKTEKSTVLDKRKKIDQELDRLKKMIPEKMRQLMQLESSLIYKNEEKINTAIQRLEWNLKVQPFKLMEEKKIVSEIDRLKRSKKTLVQYTVLKQDISAIRDMQRSLRDKRDVYFQVIGKLNSDENRIRRESASAKTMLSVLKREIDDLYESKRQLAAHHKRQAEEFQGAKEKQRMDSWKAREDHAMSIMAERRKRQLLEFEIEKIPFDKYINWCNSLIAVLNRYNGPATQPGFVESLSPASSVEEPELAEEIDDGQFVLLKKPDDGRGHALETRRSGKKNRKPRKQSSVKKVTLSPDMVQQLMELGLKPPNSTSEVSEAIESLRIKKILLEQDQQASEVASDAGISATESIIHEMSRQVSKTESYEGAVDTNPGDQVYADLFYGCLDKQTDQPEGWEGTEGVGTWQESSEILVPKSDSSVDVDTESSVSLSSVCDGTDTAGYSGSSFEEVRESQVMFLTEASRSEPTLGSVIHLDLPSAEDQVQEFVDLNFDLPSSQGQIQGFSKLNLSSNSEINPSSNTDCHVASSVRPTENLDCRLKSEHGGDSVAVASLSRSENMALHTCCSSSTGCQVMSSTSKFDSSTPLLKDKPNLDSLSHSDKTPDRNLPVETLSYTDSRLIRNSHVGNLPDRLSRAGNSPIGNLPVNPLAHAGNMTLGNLLVDRLSRAGNPPVGNLPVNPLAHAGNMTLGNLLVDRLSRAGSTPVGNSHVVPLLYKDNTPVGNLSAAQLSHIGNTPVGNLPVASLTQKDNTPVGNLSVAPFSHFSNTTVGILPVETVENVPVGNLPVGNLPVNTISHTDNTPARNLPSEPSRPSYSGSSWILSQLPPHKSSSSSSSSPAAEERQSVVTSAAQLPPGFLFGDDEFPSLSEAANQSRPGSNISTRSSNGCNMTQTE